MQKQSIQWRKYFLEFLSIFIGVTLAFSLNKWNENRRDTKAETKILAEIRNGLKTDLQDIKGNKKGHEKGIRACEILRQLALNKPVNNDSVGMAYYTILRDYISIQNKSGYEALKSKGLETIADDSLRLTIIELYDSYYEIIEKLEENYSDLQFHRTYYFRFNDLLSPYMEFDKKGHLSSIRQPLTLSKTDKNKLLSYLIRIEANRKFMKKNYDLVEVKIKELLKLIKKELDD